MNKAQFTKGPWKLGGFNYDTGLIDIDSEKGQHQALATVVWEMSDEPVSPECRANAHLIKAAPGLYSALARVVEGKLLDVKGYPELTLYLYAQLEEILADARGEHV